MSGFHKSQSDQLGATLTVVDENDNIIGETTKLAGHEKAHETFGEGRHIQHPHRAFSLFLFNENNELLLQQRSAEKITFPNLWTNSVCSHPTHTPDEIDTEDYKGPRLAAVRRTAFELNLPLDLDSLHCGARILYYADADTRFAEYEIDYIVFAKMNSPQFVPNPDEVMDYAFVA